MSFEHRPSPSRVTEAAAATFPRWLLFALLAVYIVPGLFGRAPWSPDDASAFGVAWSMATGSSLEWWLPSVAGEPLPEEGPLPFWVGALFAQWFGPWLGDVTAARLVTMLWFTIGTWALWYATYRLARREEAQPVALAFGGEASPRNYGRMLADIAVLLLTATLGVLVRFHETGAEPALLALVCVLLFALAYSLDDPWKGAFVAGATLGAIALTRGWLPAGVLLLAAIVFTGVYGDRRIERATLITLLAILVFSLWPTGARLAHPHEAESYLADWWRWNRASVGIPQAEGLLWLARNVGWYAWPLWPFALWTIYSWRHFLHRPHMALPLIIVAAGLVAVLLSASPSDREFLLAVPTLVVLAAFGVSSLKRTAEDAIDWFSLALFSLALCALWLYFGAWNTGVPPKMAASIVRLAPGFEPEVQVATALVALAATVLWIMIVAWRIRVRPPMVWTGPFIAASGLSLLWLAAVALFAPAIDYARSYASIAPVLAQQIDRVGGDSCVQTVGLPAGTRAMLAYYGAIRFERPADAGLCRVALQRDSQRTAADDAPPAGRWKLAYDVTRRARFDEAFRVWVRQPD
jgi:4-amino-4-deoxy-L-arabinose transferase-like glycosyltransferase